MPEIDTPTLKPLKKGLIDAAKLDGAAFLNYCDVKGSEKLRQQIARLALDSGCQLHPDEIIVTSGCQEALVCSLRAVTNPGRCCGCRFA